MRSICVVSYNNGLTHNLTSANSLISDFLSLGKLFIIIKNDNGFSTDPQGKPEDVFNVSE